MIRRSAVKPALSCLASTKLSPQTTAKRALSLLSEYVVSPHHHPFRATTHSDSPFYAANFARAFSTDDTTSSGDGQVTPKGDNIVAVHAAPSNFLTVRFIGHPLEESTDIETNSDLVAKLIKKCSADTSNIVSCNLNVVEDEKGTLTESKDTYLIECVDQQAAWLEFNALNGATINNRTVRASIGKEDVIVDYRKEAGDKSLMSGFGREGAIGDDEWAEVMINDFLTREENSDLSEEELEKAFDKFLDEMDLETVRKQAVEKAQMQDLGLVYDETQDGYVDATSLKGPPVDEYVDEFGGRDAIKAFDALTFEERISPGDGEEQLTEEDKKMLADLDKRLDELKNWTDELLVDDMNQGPNFEDTLGKRKGEEEEESDYYLDDYQREKAKEYRDEMAARKEQDKEWDTMDALSKKILESHREQFDHIHENEEPDLHLKYKLSQDADGKFAETIVKVNRVQKVTHQGVTVSYRALVICGNIKGAGGFGVGKAGSPNEAMLLASQASRRNLVHVDRFEGYGLAHDCYGEHNNCKVTLRSLKPGTGNKGNKLISELLSQMGILDVSSKAHGRRNPYAVIRATFKALIKHQGVEEAAMKRGKRLMTLERSKRIGINV